MLKKSILILSLFFLYNCSSTQFIKVNWQADLIKKTDEINYLYWREGVQFFTQHNDSLSVSVAGFSHDNIIYILGSMTNDTERPITFFPQHSSLQYQSGKKNIELKPIRPKNLDKGHFSFFNTVLVGAGSISRLFINLPIDMLVKDKDKGDDAISNIGQDYDNIKITKKIFISTQTIYPKDQFAGFLVFEYDDDFKMKDDQFIFKINFDNKDFTANGTFAK